MTSSVHKSEPKSNSSKSNFKSGNGSSQSKQKNNNSSTTSSKGSTSEKKEPPPDLSLKLRKYGKLTLQECQCCLDNDLCLFCDTAGHIAKDFLKVSSVAAKAHAANADKSMLSTYSLDPKKD